MHTQLRIVMRMYSTNQAELGKAIDRSPMYMSDRMAHKRPWNIDDVYKICDFFNSKVPHGDPLPMPYERLHEFFPPKNQKSNR